MDACCWLVDNGVAPDAIRWIRPRDAWTNDRAAIQPLRLVGAFAQWLASQNEASAEAEDLRDLLHRLEDNGVLIRLDPNVEPSFFRGAILSEYERTTLRSIENVVRLGRVVHIGAERIELEEGSIPTDTTHVHVDCTAAGLAASPNRPIFEDDRITLAMGPGRHRAFQRSSHRLRRGDPRRRQRQEPAVPTERVHPRGRRPQLRPRLGHHAASGRVRGWPSLTSTSG